jgi:PAS domain S-box-containing protein
MNSQYRILVVDDNRATQYTTARILRGAGFQIVEAGTGSEALTAAQSNIDLVVLDINLPDMTGFEVCQQLRAQPTTARLPVLHLSATLTTDMDKARGLAGGADGYLTHPLEPLVLLGTVNALLRARRAEDESRRSEAKLRAIFDGAPSGICVLSGDGIFEEANPAICQLLGVERTGIVGKSLIDFSPTDRRGDVMSMLRDLETTGRFRGLLPLQRVDGSIVEVDWNMTFDTTTGVQLGIVTDITQEKKSELERERLLTSERTARSEAERANRVKDEFLATLSHELRNPLNAIIGWSGVLRSRELAPESVRGLEAIERNARIQAQLISDLLDVSRINAGKLRLEIELIDLGDVVRSALDAVMPAAHAKEIEIRQVMAAEGARVRGDAGRLQQVIWNLLSNAVKFTPKGGKVDINLSRVHSNLELSICDNGRGIRQEFVPHLFERFRQEDPSPSKSFAGLGLGLAIVKHLTEMHGGEVRANSGGEDQGASFVISLPIGAVSGEEGTRPTRVPPQSWEPIDLTGIKVLLVEDDADARAVIGLLLRDVQAEVIEADGVDQALSLIRKVNPDLLVSDIGMARRDGYDLIRQVRRLGYKASQLPAIALTAFARPEDRREALLAGYQMHLSKPVDPQELRATAASLVGRTGAAMDQTA